MGTLKTTNLNVVFLGAPFKGDCSKSSMHISPSALALFFTSLVSIALDV